MPGGASARRLSCDAESASPPGCRTSGGTRPAAPRLMLSPGPVAAADLDAWLGLELDLGYQLRAMSAVWVIARILDHTADHSDRCPFAPFERKSNRRVVRQRRFDFSKHRVPHKAARRRLGRGIGAACNPYRPAGK